MPAKKRTTTGATRTRKPRQAPPAAEPPPSPFTASSFTPGMAPDCMMCPFGLFYFTMRNTRPEVMEHLTAAGHELFLAFRALVEQAGERWEQSQSLQRITVR
jgi:uncharacterized protein DUF5304